MKQWKSLVALHSSAPSCFPQPPAPSPCPSPPREPEKKNHAINSSPEKQPSPAVRLVGSDGKVRTYERPVTARELMQQHPRHLICRADALLIGEKIPAVDAGEELEPGKAYFLLPSHLFHSVLSFVSLASSLLLLLSAAGAGGASAAGGGKKQRPFELLRTDSGNLQIKFSDEFLLAADDKSSAAAAESTKPPVLAGDKKLEKEYEELVGYSKARRWSPKLETIQEIVAGAGAAVVSGDGGGSTTTATTKRSKGRSLPFLGRLGSRRRRETATTTTTINGSAVACSG
uniref:Uncharacterized protein n=1 Tax=Leersia perrieri TaxID=77586 RepID=A0A0D9XSP7_9ORYZ